MRFMRRMHESFKSNEEIRRVFTKSRSKMWSFISFYPKVDVFCTNYQRSTPSGIQMNGIRIGSSFT